MWLVGRQLLVHECAVAGPLAGSAAVLLNGVERLVGRQPIGQVCAVVAYHYRLKCPQIFSYFFKVDDLLISSDC